MVGKQNNKRFISHGTPLKYDFLMFSFILFSFFCLCVFCYRSPLRLCALHRVQGGVKVMQIIEINKIDLWI